MTNDKLSVRFAASLPDIQSAISIGSGCRIKLEVPESEIAEVIKLAAYGRNKVLYVSITEEDSISSDGGEMA